MARDAKAELRGIDVAERRAVRLHVRFFARPQHHRSACVRRACDLFGREHVLAEPENARAARERLHVHTDLSLRRDAACDEALRVRHAEPNALRDRLALRGPAEFRHFPARFAERAAAERPRVGPGQPEPYMTFRMADDLARPHALRMLHSIRTTRELPPETQEPLDLLVACHAKLRHFSALALALATRKDLEPEQIVDASHRLLRYFKVALPLHEADEEESLAPALLAVATPAELATIEQMCDQHELLHDVLDELFPFWEQLEREPKSIEGSDTAPQARRLATVLDVHLELEESTIFPISKQLPDAERKRLFAEMRGRRSPEVMTEMKRITT